MNSLVNSSELTIGRCILVKRTVSIHKWTVGSRCRNDSAELKLLQNFSSHFLKESASCLSPANVAVFVTALLDFLIPLECSCGSQKLVSFLWFVDGPPLLVPFHIFLGKDTFSVTSFLPPCETRDMVIDPGYPSKRRKHVNA